jgi:hypothetical protein
MKWWWNQIMTCGLVVPFPVPGGLTQDDLERLYRFAADCPDAQISVLVGGSRRTSAILALAEHYLRIERDGEAVLVREAFSGIPARQATPGGDWLGALRAMMSMQDEPSQPQVALVG